MLIAKRLVKENDGNNANPERKRQIMDLAMRSKAAELIGEKKGLKRVLQEGYQEKYQEGFQKGLHQSAVNAVINLAKVAKGTELSRETIFKFAQAMANGHLSDDEINRLIDQQDYR